MMALNCLERFQITRGERYRAYSATLSNKKHLEESSGNRTAKLSSVFIDFSLFVFTLKKEDVFVIP